MPGFGNTTSYWNTPFFHTGWSWTKNCRSRLTIKAWNSFSCTMPNLVTRLPFHGSKTSNVRRAFRPGRGGGSTVRSRWYSAGSGMLVTRVMPQRGHLPGSYDRMSLSMGHR